MKMRTWWIGALAAAGMAISPAHGEAPRCAPVDQIALGNGRDGQHVADVWSGTVVVLDAVARASIKYFGYYNPQRWLSVAKLDTAAGTVCHVSVKSQFAGWDSHDSIVMGLDPAGNVHVAGNMHDVPLVYGAMVGGDFATMTLRPMIGKDETRVTYPMFINRADGKLVFLYRDGVSGSGRWLVNLFDDGKWRRLSDRPILAEQWQGRATSAYPSAFRFSRDGYLHLAIVWRRTFDVSTNYAISYVQTRDFVHWSDHTGRPVELPINPGSDLIEQPGENSGLLNSARATVSPDGQLIITYTLYGIDGRNVIVLASPDGAGWRRQVVATAARQTVEKGGGTIPVAPTYPDPVYDGHGGGALVVSFPGEAPQRIYFDTSSLEVSASHSPPPAVLDQNPSPGPMKLVPPSGLVDTQKMARYVRTPTAAGEGPPDGSFVYFAQGINRDVKRPCTTQQPQACDPSPSPLIYVPN